VLKHYKDDDMGHIRLGVLPKNPTWNSIIRELESRDISAEELSDAVLTGANDILRTEATKSCVSYSVWLLAQLVLASKSENFSGELSKIGINITPDTSAIEFISNVSQVTNRDLSKIIPRTAINNIANISVREALTQTISVQSNTLFGSGTEEFKNALRKYSTQKQFSNLLHKYFSVFLRRTIRLVVDKEIGNHIGPQNTFENIQAVNQFESRLSSFSNQTTRIVDTFSSGWYSKKVWQEGTISSDEAGKFAYVALKKLRNDLEISRGQS
jgi:hypothetical protein